MKSVTTPLRLNPEMEKVLNDIRAAEKPGLLYGRTAAEAEKEVRGIGMPVLEDANLSQVVIMQYSWFLRELARVFRTRTGHDLAWHIETVMRKWLGYGLEPNTMQYLVSEIHLKMKAAGTTAKDEVLSTKDKASTQEDKDKGRIPND